MAQFQKIVRSCSAILASTLLIDGAQAALSRGIPALLVGQTSGASPPELLPEVHSPRPYRQVVWKPCKETECSLKFEAIADLRLLEISNVTCIAIQSEADSGKFFVLSKSSNLNKLYLLIAILPVTSFAANSITTSQAGPFYFNAGETPYVSASTVGGGYAMICTISGTLWQTG
jgi:hypothetical protein